MTTTLTTTLTTTATLLLITIGQWMILEKFGEKGWKILIPFYGEYLIFKHIWNKKIFWVNLAATLTLAASTGATATFAQLAKEAPEFQTAAFVFVVVTLLVSVVNFVLKVMVANKLSKAFGHGTGYTLGLIFFQPVFDMVLGFGKDEYIGNVAA